MPTHAVVEALAALVAYDPDAALDDERRGDDRGRVERVRAGEVTQAVRDSVAECGPIARGRLDRDHPRRHRASRPTSRGRRRDRAASTQLVDDDSELVTVLVGADARRRRHRAARASTSGSTHPHVEVEVHEGDQPLYPYLIGVE